MIPKPGNITFLFTDIEGSTRLAQDFRDVHQELIAKHHSIIEEAVKLNGGHIFKTIGDAFCCAFENVSDAVNAAVESQTKLSSEDWGDVGMKVRMGIHTGTAEWNGKDYMGYLTLARSNRIMSASHGGQIVISDDSVKASPDSNSEFTTYPYKDKNLQGKLITLRDLGERRLKDLAEPVRIYQVLAKGLPSEFRPLMTLDFRPNNLPVQLTSFVGRQEELKAVSRMIEDSRLLSLIGPGGTGKSRLALQIAAEMIDRFDNGVWLVELASITDHTLLAEEVIRALNIPEVPGRSSDDIVIGHLREKKLVMILDNCEHLVQGVSGFAEFILKNCQYVKLVVTSREALHCMGEKIYMLSSLGHPGREDVLEPGELVKYESVRLFIERALTINSSFRLNEGNASAVQKICSQLDGIPLAIELAAVRLKVLSLDSILKKLDDRFRLLTGGNRTALPRQQTLRAMIDWSYDMLDEKEKLLFQRLSVFAGGWTIEAAEQICSDELIEEFELIDVLSNLIDKSLITQRDNKGSIRFGMLETIKQYATMVTGDIESVRKRHLNYYEGISNHRGMRASGLTQLEWVNLADSERDNIRHAIYYSMKTEPSAACRIVKYMTDFWQLKGRFSEGREFCNILLEQKPELNDSEIGNLYYSLALFEYEAGRVSAAEEFAKKSKAHFESAGHREGQAAALNVMGVVLNMASGRFNEAREYQMSALEMYRELGNELECANVQYNLSFTLIPLGEMEKAQQLKIEALKIYREKNETYRIALILTSIGTGYLNQRQLDEAEECIMESLAISTEIGSKYLESANNISLGSIYANKGIFDKALVHLKEGIRISNEAGYLSNLVAAWYYFGELQLKMEKYSAAAGNYAMSIKLSCENSIDFFMLNNICGLARTYLKAQEITKAVHCAAVFDVLSKCHGMRIMKKPDYDTNEMFRDISGKMTDAQFAELIKQYQSLSKQEILEEFLKFTNPDYAF